MQHLQPDLRNEYLRWLSIVGDNDNYGGARTLGIKEVIKAHFLIADFFLEEGKDLGGVGPKSLDLLHSALYRPHMCYGGVCKWTDKYEMVATLLFGLVMDHPFHDANKRTAFLCTIYLLEKMGYTPTVSHKDFEDFLVEIAEHKLPEKPSFDRYKKKCDDPEIQYIAWWLKKNTRLIDNRQYIITFRDLKRILNKFGFDLIDPDQNYIDVVQYINAPIKSFLKGKPQVAIRKLGRIGFPGMTRQVQKGDLKKVRELTKLTHEFGVDSQVFFREADPLNRLIAEYQEPLRRLADR